MDSNDAQTLRDYLTNPYNLPLDLNPNEILTEHGI